MRGGKEEEENSMVIYAVCTGGCAEEAEVCVQRWMCRGGRGGCVGACIHTCLTSENMSPGGDTGLNFADCSLSFKVTGHCKWA